MKNCFIYLITSCLSVQFCMAQMVAYWGIPAQNAQKIVVQTLQTYQKTHEIKTLRLDAGSQRYTILDAIDWRQGNKAAFFYRFNQDNAVVFTVEVVDTALFMRAEEHLIYPKTMTNLKGSRFLIGYGKTPWVQKDESLMSATQARYHTFTLFNTIKAELKKYREVPYSLPTQPVTPKVNNSTVLPTTSFVSTTPTGQQKITKSNSTVSSSANTLPPQTKPTATIPLVHTVPHSVSPTKVDVSTITNACPLCKGEKRIIQSKPQRCQVCKGKKHVAVPCNLCSNTGKVNEQTCTVCGGQGNKNELCNHCGGIGFLVIKEQVTCVYCSGRGTK